MQQKNKVGNVQSQYKMQFYDLPAANAYILRSAARSDAAQFPFFLSFFHLIFNFCTFIYFSILQKWSARQSELIDKSYGGRHDSFTNTICTAHASDKWKMTERCRRNTSANQKIILRKLIQFHCVFDITNSIWITLLLLLMLKFAPIHDAQIREQLQCHVCVHRANIYL